MRQILSDAGAAQGSVLYDPWGQVQRGTVPTFGFTGELQQGNNVYLRARWYNASRGTFTSRDSFAGWPAQPYSLMPYQYAYANPVLLTDSSGRNPCEGHENGGSAPPFGYCPDGTPIQSSVPQTTPTIQICPNQILYQPLDIGYIEGFSGTIGGGVMITGGIENVFDLYDFEYGGFAYGGGGAFTDAGGNLSAYLGVVTGWSNYAQRGVFNYSGPFVAAAVSVTIPFDIVGGSVQGFASRDKTMYGALVAVSVGASENPLPIGISGSVTNYWLVTQQTFNGGKKMPTSSDAWAFAGFIINQSIPMDPTTSTAVLAGRAFAIAVVLKNGQLWDKLAKSQ